jgi:hypothetical protein
MCQTITELLALGIVPVCNENDIFYSNTSNKEFMMQHQVKLADGPTQTMHTCCDSMSLSHLCCAASHTP